MAKTSYNVSLVFAVSSEILLSDGKHVQVPRQCLGKKTSFNGFRGYERELANMNKIHFTF